MAKPLSPPAARRTAKALRDELGQADRSRLDQILKLMDADGRIRLGNVLKSLYADQPRDAGLTALRQFRARLRDAAAEAGIRLALEADSQTRTEPNRRWCWFEGEDAAAATAAQLSKSEAAGVRRDAQDAVDLTEKPAGKITIRFFVSYAHADKRLKEDLLKRLRPRLDIAAKYDFQLWQDRDILPGETWRDEIRNAIDDCQFGLLLVSPSFLASRFIACQELPRFVPADLSEPEPEKRAMPVALKPVRFDGTMDLKGLQHVQVFHDPEDKAFSERKGTKCDAFADALFGQIIRVLDQYPIEPPPPASETPPKVDRYAAIMQRRIDIERADFCFVPTHGTPGTADKLEVENAPVRQAGERRDALEYLDAWVRDSDSQPYCALLGDTGMGKTTTCLEFTRTLLAAREKNPAAPLPVYLDLRHLGDKAKGSPTYTEIIDTVLAKSWRGGQPEIDLAAEDVIRLVQQEGAVAIFDGLDEVLVHLSPAAGQVFTQELYRTLPPKVVRDGRKPGAVGRTGRLLITCRTHYFRTARDQKTHLTSRDRDAIDAKDYRILLLLPLTEEQIRTYFEANLPGEDPDRVIDLIRSVHNLAELAERPYTLSLIARHISQIEQWRLEGRRVTGVDLYRHMVQSWLERDTGKHQIIPDHKMELMERFAASLWRSGNRAWTVADVEQWLIDLLVARPALAAHYDGKDRELLKEDLRTATFLVRVGEADFRFAHTSLLEFFLAAYLRRALSAGRSTDWDLPPVSTETLDFLGQMLLSEEVDRDPGAPEIGALRAMRNRYQPRVSELAFAYVLAAYAKGWPAPSAAGFHLDGANLRDWTIAGTAGQPLLNLQRASFRGANLEGARLRFLDLSEADFSGARHARAELRDGRARGARFDSADLSGTVFRHVDLESARFGGAKLHRSQWLGCRLAETSGLDATPPAALFALCEPADRFASVPAQSARLEPLDGHCSFVGAGAFSPDGNRLASASLDGTLRIWDVASGDCLIVLRGHEGWVGACAFSPDGSHLASASGDHTLRLWSIASGDCLTVLHGHDDWVGACAFSPDGSRLASGSGDHTLRIWDAASGDCLNVLRGHEGGVSACAFSPDGGQLASASGNHTLQLWDTASGECLTVLRGHEKRVTACAFSPDGSRLVSSSADCTLRLWDAASGDCLTVLHGHEDPVTSCAFSPDGSRLVSASLECTLRLWDVGAGTCLTVLRGHEGAVWGCAFSPEGDRIASASHDRTLRLWDVTSGNCLAVLRGHEKRVTACAFSPDGTRLASASADGTVRLWDAISGACLTVLHGHDDVAPACAFSPDGDRIATTSEDGVLRLWDAASGDCLTVLRGHEAGVNVCAFSPDGTCIASASLDHTLRLWDTASGDCLTVLRGHEAGVSVCAFSPDGTCIASASLDHTLRLWDTASGDCLAVLRGHERGVWSCAFSPDGSRLASGSWDGTVRFWDTASWRETGFRVHLFWDGAFASRDPAGNRVIQVSGDAWRYLGWIAADPVHGLIRYPAETFGPLPTATL